MCLVTIEAQVAEPTPGSFTLTVTTGHLGHYWSSNPADLKANTWEDAHAEAQHAVGCLRAAILGEVALADNEEEHRG